MLAHPKIQNFLKLKYQDVSRISSSIYRRCLSLSDPVTFSNIDQKGQTDLSPQRKKLHSKKIKIMVLLEN